LLGAELELGVSRKPVILRGACEDRLERGDNRRVELRLNCLRKTKASNSARHRVSIRPI